MRKRNGLDFLVHHSRCPGSIASPTELFDASQLVGVPGLALDDNVTNRRILKDSLLLWKMLPTVVEDAAAARQVLQHRGLSQVDPPLILRDARPAN